MLYNGVLVSALKQSESAIHIHISPYLLPLASPSHPPYPIPLGGHKALCGCFPPAIYFTFGSICKSIPLSHFIPAYPCPSPCPQVHSLRLLLYSCPAPRFIKTFFLDSIYMCWHTVFVFLLLTYFTLYDRL